MTYISKFGKINTVGNFVKKLLIKSGVLLIKDSLTIKYLTGVNVAEGYLVVGTEKACFTDARYFSMVKPMLEKAGVKPLFMKDFSSVIDYIKSLGAKTVYLDYTLTNVCDYKKIQSHFIVRDGHKKLCALRATKLKSEIESIKRACKIAQEAYYYAIDKVELGMTEIQLKDLLEQKMLSLGATGTSFETIVAFGKNSAVPHHQTGQTKLEKNKVILIDMGCKVNGYCSDITRTCFFGEPDKEFIDCYNIVLQANEKAIEKITVGTLTCEADSIARDVFKESGLSQNFTHSLGHGVGLEIHEYPFISPKTKQRLENRMVFTIEPGLYFDGKFGIRIEDTVLLKKGKVQRLYTDDKKLKVIN